MEHKRPLESVPDDELLRRLAELLGQSRRVECELVAHIGEVDERRLYAREASPSMFVYCTEVLHLSEAEAYLRIAAARASREHPILLTMLGDGRVHLTGIAKLAPHLTRENRDVLLKRATHRSKRQIEELIAEIAPRPDAPAVMRKLPQRRGKAQPTPTLSLGPDGIAPSVELRLDRVATPEPEVRLDGAAVRLLELRPDRAAASPAPAQVPPAVVQPLAPARYKVQFTASEELHDKLERLQALMRSQVPDGDLAARPRKFAARGPGVDTGGVRTVNTYFKPHTPGQFRSPSSRFSSSRAPTASESPTSVVVRAPLLLGAEVRSSVTRK